MGSCVRVCVSVHGRVCVCVTGAGVWEEKAVLKGAGVGEGMWLQSPVQGAWGLGVLPDW